MPYTEIETITVQQLYERTHQSGQTFTVPADTPASEGVEYLLPVFQRGVSWDTHHQIHFIETLRKGHPFGAILVAHVEGDGDRQYLVIDGQQRTTAILEYFRRQNDFVTLETIDPESLGEITQLLSDRFDIELDSETAHSALTEAFQAIDLGALQVNQVLGFFVDRGLFSNESMQEAIQDSQFLGSIYQKLKSLITAFDISQVHLPVLKFVGPEWMLPDVFDSLNNGVPLNKYQQFAARWRVRFSLSDMRIKQSVRNYWVERLKDQEIEVSGLDPDGVPVEPTLFDVLSGTSYSLYKAYETKSLIKESWANHFAFNAAVVMHGKHPKMMMELQSIVLKRLPQNGPYDLKPFIDALYDSVKEVNRILDPVLSLKLSSQKRTAVHSENQLISLVAYVQLKLYDPLTWERNTSKLGSSIEDAIRAWYLFDLLTDYWASAGDSKLFKRAWVEPESTSDDDDNLRPLDFYNLPPSQEEFRLAAQSWLSRENSKNERARKSLDGVTKVFLKFAYTDRITNFADGAITFHIDHVIPVDWWDRYLKGVGGTGGAPFNTIGNMCLMMQAHNQSKKAKLPLTFFREYQLGNSETREDFEKRCIEDYFLVDSDDLGSGDSGVTWSQLDFPELQEPIQAELATEEQFSRFRDRQVEVNKARFAVYLDRVCKLLNLS